MNLHTGSCPLLALTLTLEGASTREATNTAQERDERRSHQGKRIDDC
jgi:hypothetical protein